MNSIRFTLALLTLASLAPRAIAVEDSQVDLVQALTSFEWQCSSASDPQKDGTIQFLLGGKIATPGGALLPWNWQLTGSHAVQVHDQASNQQALTFNADFTEFESSGTDGKSPLHGVRLAPLNGLASLDPAAQAELASLDTTALADSNTGMVYSTYPLWITRDWVRDAHGHWMNRHLARVQAVKLAAVRLARLARPVAVREVIAPPIARLAAPIAGIKTGGQVAGPGMGSQVGSHVGGGHVGGGHRGGGHRGHRRR